MTLNSLAGINAAILNGEFTDMQLAQITETVKLARARLNLDARRQMKIGCEVEFFNTRHHRTYTGKVISIMQKNVRVDCGTLGLWRVPANMCQITTASTV